MDWHADVESTKHTNRSGEHSPQDATYYYDWEHVYQSFKKRLNGLFDLSRIDEIVKRMLEIESFLKCDKCGTKFQGQSHESMEESKPDEPECTHGRGVGLTGTGYDSTYCPDCGEKL